MKQSLCSKLLKLFQLDSYFRHVALLEKLFSPSANPLFPCISLQTPEFVFPESFERVDAAVGQME